MVTSNSCIIAEYDDLMRRYRVLADDDLEKNLLGLMESLRDWWKKMSGFEDEVVRLQDELVKSKNEVHTLKMKLSNARNLLDKEIVLRNSAESEKNDLEKQISMVLEMLSKGGNINETKERLLSLSLTRRNFRDGLSPMVPSTIQEEPDTMGSILNVSEMDLTEADDLTEDMSKTRSGRVYRESRSFSKKRRSSPGKANLSSRSKKQSKSSSDEEDKENNRNIPNVLSEKVLENFERKRRAPPIPSAPPVSDDNVEIEGKALTSFPSNVFFTPQRHHHQFAPNAPYYQNGTPLTGSIYGSGGNSPNIKTGSTTKINQRPHCFTSKTIYWTDSCQPCMKRIKFGKQAYKCRDCKATCHLECKEKVPLPCVPSVNTPGTKGPIQGYITDYAPNVPPMIPAIIVHCTNEIESRGLTEVGIYRVPGSDREIKELKERFLKGKGVPNLSQIDIHVICCVLKSFLRNLKEPLIPNSLWRDFVAAAEKEETQDSLAVLYQAISDLPQPNRDTLAWLICHLQNVSTCVECKMPISNLAKVFGPTVVGNSIANPQPMDVISETKLQQKVMELLLGVSSDYWGTFLKVDENYSLMNNVFSPENNGPAGNTRRRSIITVGTLPARLFSVVISGGK